MKNIVAPSLLAANKDKLVDEVQLIEKLGAEYLHFDVMDGKFVPNVSFSSTDLKKISPFHSMINDVHIMVFNPLEVAKEYINNGAHIITFHYEALSSDEEVFNVINEIKKLDVMVGLSIKPKTEVKNILKFLPLLDLILIMSVEPGFGGQSFIYSSLEKVEFLRNYIDENKYKTLIEIDGGINGETGQIARKSGADILVAGSYLFGHEDIKERIRKLR